MIYGSQLGKILWREAIDPKYDNLLTVLDRVVQAVRLGHRDWGSSPKIAQKSSLVAPY
jgi:hypothetical protein